MNAMTPMRQRWRFERLRVHVALYWYPGAPRWHASRSWGGRRKRDGTVARGIGAQLRIGGHVIEPIVWPTARRITRFGIPPGGTP